MLHLRLGKLLHLAFKFITFTFGSAFSVNLSGRGDSHIKVTGVLVGFF